ncbi:MAG TPA: hypothetical protein VM939_10745 [Gemmatimonadaceae bacterium]|nr:hypothetical protein [Gemmatimonadaceae bacterium]
MRIRPAVLTLIAGVSIACSEDSARPVTSPDFVSGRANAVTPACDAKLGRAIVDQQRALFDRTSLKGAQALWDVVTGNCASNNAQAKEDLLTYVQYSIDAEAAGTLKTPSAFASPAAAVVSHWNSVFTYVGHPQPDLPSTVLESTGAAKVVPGSITSAVEVSIPAKAAITISPQIATGDQRGHLITIYPLSDDCLTGTNLIQTGKCFEFSANPSISPKLNPGAKIGICQPLNETSHGNIPALAHLVSGKTLVLPPTTSTYPSLAFCNGTSTVGLWEGGAAGFARRLVSLAASTFGVKHAYAAHGGLGGIGGSLSPFGGVDRLVFSASFTSAAGSPPGAPDVGSWLKIFATAPGSILVQGSLGTMTNSPAVLAQGGGNCAQCGGLDLWGKLNAADTGVYASDGVYSVKWTSLQNGPTMKSAPFVLRSSTGQEIARVTYSTVSSVNYLTYNAGTAAGTWVRNVGQDFEITVDLNTKKTSLKVGGTPIAGAQDVSFVSATATNFASVRAEFSGIDSGIIGWDNVVVERLADQ